MGNGGQASECGWCIDRWGLRWQIIPRVLTHAIAAGGETAQRAFAAMQTMQKIDIAAIEAELKALNPPAAPAEPRKQPSVFHCLRSFRVP